MEDPSNKDFPRAFGKCVDDFLERYGNLIYKMIIEKIKIHSELDLDVEEIFNDFFLFIRNRNFKKLRQFRGESQQTTYLVKIFRNFFIDKYRKPKRSENINIEETKGISDIPLNYYNGLLKSKLIREAFKATITKISKRQKLIFDRTYFIQMNVREIAYYLNIKPEDVYVSNRKVKDILRKELKKGALIKKDFKTKPPKKIFQLSNYKYRSNKKPSNY